MRYLLGKLTEMLANVFMCYHDRYSLKNCPIAYALIFYKRYEDDIFVMLKSENHVNTVLKSLNFKHPNIQFTCEKESEISLEKKTLTITIVT